MFSIILYCVCDLVCTIRWMFLFNTHHWTFLLQFLQSYVICLPTYCHLLLFSINVISFHSVVHKNTSSRIFSKVFYLTNACLFFSNIKVSHSSFLYIGFIFLPRYRFYWPNAFRWSLRKCFAVTFSNWSLINFIKISFQLEFSWNSSLCFIVRLFDMRLVIP